MSFEIVTSSIAIRRRSYGAAHWGAIVGLSAGLTGVYIPLVGLTHTLATKHVYADVVNLGQLLTLLPAFGAGYFGSADNRNSGSSTAAGLVAIMLAALGPLALIVLIQHSAIRSIFINASHETAELLTFGQQSIVGLVWAGAIFAAAGVLGAMVSNLLPRARSVLLAVSCGAIVIVVLQDFLRSVLTPIPFGRQIVDALFTWQGPSLLGIATGGIIGATLWLLRSDAATRPSTRLGLLDMPMVGWLLSGMLAVAAAIAGGPFVAQIVLLVSIYVLMGLGLNIEVGFAGLLDLGFVAFFAIGAYTVALLTTQSELSFANLSVWAALPIAGAAAVIAGTIFGLPVLRVRGDYLAVATMGLGEIVRVLVVSEALKPLIGGSQGILGIPKPSLGGFLLGTPVELALLAICLVALAVYAAVSLQKSKLGRTWMAIRDDEEAAQSLGINLVSSKLLAYGIGAGFAGIAGGLFASAIGSVFPHSFHLIISINVLALIILGGLGSTAGVVVGAVALVGLPEILREFGEFRFLLYGFVLVLIMRLMPQGLWPARSINMGDRS